MPTRFHCPECHQRLSVDTLKEDQHVKCPRCRRVVRVPNVSVEERGAPPLPDGPPPASLVSAEPPSVSTAPPGSRADVPGDDGAGHVRVPRVIIYCQGLLLGGVALLFFIFGLIVGGHSQPATDGPPGLPVTVSGTVRYTDVARQSVPDESSCVILLPVATRPDPKAGADGLRPRDAEPGGTHPGIAAIRAIGGDVVRVDRRGRYRLRATAPGRYFLLVVSRHVRRREGESPQARDLAELGRYVVPATSLLENQQYLWRELQVRADLSFDHTF
jgi:DNA-directed RNA polymerase subunit RPC12/RpoP